MIRKKSLPAQQEFWIARQDIKAGSSGSYFDKLGSVLDDARFGDAVREFCAPYYTKGGAGRPPLDPEVYFKMLFVSYFEGTCSERAIASRCEDSIMLRRFLGYDLTERTPDHSTLSRVRTRLPEEVFMGAFDLVLGILHEAGLLKGRKLGNDASTMEANASLESLVNRMSGESYWSYVKGLAGAAGVDTEDEVAVRRFDKNREGRKTSNKEWVNPHDRDAKVGRRKDGACDMIHKPEHTIDLESGAILAAEVLPGDKGDAQGFAERMFAATALMDEIDGENGVGAEDGEDGEDGVVAKRDVVADAGYHQKDELGMLVATGHSPVIPAPSNRALPDEEKEPELYAAALASREACGSEGGKELLKARAEKDERSFAHVLDSGGMRRTTLRGLGKINKRYLIAAAAFNLSVLMRTIFGYGTVKQFVAGNAVGNGGTSGPNYAILTLWFAWWNRGSSRMLIEPSGPGDYSRKFAVA